MRQLFLCLVLFLIVACNSGQETAVSPTLPPPSEPTHTSVPTATPTATATVTAVVEEQVVSTPVPEATAAAPVALGDLIVSHIGGYQIASLVGHEIEQDDHGYAEVSPLEGGDEGVFRYVIVGGLTEQLTADEIASIESIMAGAESFAGSEMSALAEIEFQGVPGITAVLNVSEGEQSFKGQVMVLLNEERWLMFSGGMEATRWDSEGELIFAQLLDTLELSTPLPLAKEPDQMSSASDFRYEYWELGNVFGRATVARRGNSDLLDSFIRSAESRASELGIVVPTFNEASDGVSQEATMAYLYTTTDELFDVIRAVHGLETAALFRLGVYLHVIKATYDAEDAMLRGQIYEVMNQDSQTADLPADIIAPLLAGLQAGLPSEEMAPLIWDFTRMMDDYLRSRDGS